MVICTACLKPRKLKEDVYIFQNKMAPFEKVGIYPTLPCEVPFRVAGWVKNKKKSLEIKESTVHSYILEIIEIFQN